MSKRHDYQGDRPPDEPCCHCGGPADYIRKGKPRCLRCDTTDTDLRVENYLSANSILAGAQDWAPGNYDIYSKRTRQALNKNTKGRLLMWPQNWWTK